MGKALLVVDVLSGIFELGHELHEPETFVANVARLVERARASGASVVYVQHLGKPGSPFAKDAPGRSILARIAPRAGDAIVEKEHPDSFHGSTLETVLRERGIDEVVICGFATEYCVDTTVRSAYAKGLSVVLASDAHTTTGNEILPVGRTIAHHNYVLSRFARVRTHDEIFR